MNNVVKLKTGNKDAMLEVLDYIRESVENGETECFCGVGVGKDGAMSYWLTDGDCSAMNSGVDVLKKVLVDDIINRYEWE